MVAPYEIRQVPMGQIVRVPEGSNTISYSYLGPKGPEPTSLGLLPHAVAIVNVENAEDICPGEDVRRMAEGMLARLPQRKYKLILVYRDEPEYMFDTCFLIGTDDSEWWREFEIVPTL